MNSLQIVVTITVGVLLIDLTACFYKRDSYGNDSKPAGLVSLIMLSLMSYKKKCDHKYLSLQRIFLSLIVIIFLIIAQYFLLLRGPANNNAIIIFALALLPIFVVPIYHFIYELMDISALRAQTMLFNFRLRGAISLVLCCNIVFIYLTPELSLVAWFGHFALCLLTLIGLFYLVAQYRHRPSTYQPPHRSHHTTIDTEIMRYLASLLEFFYSILIIYFVFLENPLTAWLTNKPSFVVSLGIFSGLILATAVIAQLIYRQKSLNTLELYEYTLLPASFLLFGAVTIGKYYF